MHVHILGVAGTFMASLASLAKEKGFLVTGSDQNIYPPMSTQLEKIGVTVSKGYDADIIKKLKPNLVIVGNVMTRGLPVVEYILNNNIEFISGPQFLSEYILKDKWVLAVSGTHGKTTISSMLVWILEKAGLNPSFLIGGVPRNFNISSRLKDESSFFVVEADEYDTAFFDKRSKFVHYHPKTLVISNLEYDHADIFPDMTSIQKQFHHMIRTIPSIGRIIYPVQSESVQAVMNMGCWSEIDTMGLDNKTANWSAVLLKENASCFQVLHNNLLVGEVNWQLQGIHNVKNALAAISAAYHVGILPEDSCQFLNEFSGVKRRMELLADINGVAVYDDFAHHPTAILSTLKGLRATVEQQKIRLIIELQSNTMKMGCHQQTLVPSTYIADEVIWFTPQSIQWLNDEVDCSINKIKSKIFSDTQSIINYLLETKGIDEHWVIMSNGKFDGIHQQLIKALKALSI